MPIQFLAVDYLKNLFSDSCLEDEEAISPRINRFQQKIEQFTQALNDTTDVEEINEFLECEKSISPSYSPLIDEDIQVIDLDLPIESSPVIELVKFDLKPTKTVTLRLSEELDHLKYKLKQSNGKNECYDIVMTSDTESPTYEMSMDEIVQHMNKQLLKEDNEAKKPYVSEVTTDYLEVFSVSLYTLAFMLDIIDVTCELAETAAQIVATEEANKLPVCLEDEFDKFIVSKKRDISQLPMLLTGQVTRRPVEPVKKRFDTNLKVIAFDNEAMIETHICRQIEVLLLNYVKFGYEKIRDCFRKANYAFVDLNTELCRYLVEQHLTAMRRVAPKSDTDIQKLRWLSLLNVCLNCLDLMFNCTMKSMILNLENSKSMFNNLIQVDLEELVDKIYQIIDTEFKKAAANPQNKCIRLKCPKLQNLCQYLNEIIESNTANNLKILIILSRNDSILAEKILNTILSETKLKCARFSFSESLNPHDKLLNNQDCLIANNHILIYEHLKQFTHIIIYDPLHFHNETSQALVVKKLKPLRDLCATQHIAYAEFKPYKLQENLLEFSRSQLDTNWYGRRLIVSCLITENSDLIELLETKLNFSLIERNYEKIAYKFNILDFTLPDVDILLDCSTGCLMLDTSRLDLYSKDDSILHRIESFKNKLKFLYIIFVPLGQPPKNLTSNHLFYIKMNKFCHRINKINCGLLVKLINLVQFNYFEQVFQQLYDTAMSLNPTQTRNLGLKLNCSIEPTKEEIFLLSAGCFNAFQVSYMLSVHKLLDLIKMSKSALLATFDEQLVSLKCLDLFSQMLA